MESIRLNSVALQILLVEALSIISFFVAYILLYFLFAKILNPIMPILESAQYVDITNTMLLQNIISLWDAFLIKIVIFAIVSFLVMVLFVSFFNAWSISIMNRRLLSLRYFLRFLVICVLFTLIYIFLLYAIISSMRNPYTAAYELIIVTIIYLYLLFIFFFSIDEHDPFHKLFKRGFMNSVRLHHTIVPFILFLAIFILTMGLLSLIMIYLFIGIFESLFMILLCLMLLILSVWIKRYICTLIHLIDPTIHKKHERK